jgi:GGDEF domain-containing protein
MKSTMSNLRTPVRSDEQFDDVGSPASGNDRVTGFGTHDTLMSDLTEALETGSRPSVLGLFVLEGSAEHRRDFGSRANDELIARLAEKFDSLVGLGGSCYRPREHEFCALVTGSFDEVTMAMLAIEDDLNAQDGSTPVSVRFGAASLHDEADDPVDLLMLADERLAIRSESRESRERRQSSR